jgi:hypothetical protein
VEHSTVVEDAGELRITTPEEFRLSMREQDVRKAIESIGGGAQKIKISFAETVVNAAPAARPAQTDNDAVTRRALENPEVRRFQRAFPESQVRQVRNLKE